jgi:signal transduction histidine kinase
MKTILYKFCILFFFLNFSFHLFGQVAIYVDEGYEASKIGKNLVFIEDSNLVLNPASAYEKLKRGEGTFSVQSDVPQFGFQNATKWALFKVNNNTASVKKLMLEIASPSINIVRLFAYEKDFDSLKLLGISGDTIPFSERTLLHRNPLFEIQIPPNDSVEYVLHFYKNGAVSLPIILYDSSYFIEADGLSNVLFGVYCGGIILLIIVSLIMGFLNQKLIYIFYALYTASLLFQVLISEGYGFMLFYPNGTSFSSIARGVCAIFILLFYISFTRAFLNLNQILPLYNKYLRWFSFILALVSIIVILLLNWNISSLYIAVYALYFLVLIIFSATILAGILALKHNRVIAVLYLVGYGFVIIGSLLYLLSKIGWIPHLFIARYGLVLGSILEILTLGVGLALLTRKTFQNKFLLEKSLLEKENELNKALLVGENKERLRIAQDLHDGIGVQLRLLKQQLTNHSNPMENEAMVDKIAEEIRTISHNLMPSNIEHLGLENLVSDLVHNLSNSNDIDIKLVAIDCPYLNDQIVGLSLFRIIQECLQNAIKHSEAKSIVIQMIGHENELSITIEDDGKGMNHLAKAGIGLNNIKSRMEQLKGTYTMESNEHLGVLVCLTVPIPD